MKKIIVDVMSGDKAPRSLVKGVYRASQDFDAEYIIVGDKNRIEEVAKELDISIDSFEIVHTTSVITMEDEPLSVTKEKSDSSMALGLKLLAEGKGDAFVSAGNTGALFAGATLIVKKLKGVKRPAIAALLPMEPPVLLLDSGANIMVTPDDLEQFALMGEAYMRDIYGIMSPRVGLLNNGAEDCKGTPLQIETYKRLAANEKINFVGNVEGNRVTQNACDVLVTDGFTGNIMLKTMEGMGKFALKTIKNIFTTNARTTLAGALVKPYVQNVKKNFDSTELGGAPFLGVTRPVIKAHGSSGSKAFKNAIGQAIAYSESDLSEDICSAMEELNAKRRAQKEADKAKKD